MLQTGRDFGSANGMSENLLHLPDEAVKPWIKAYNALYWTLFGQQCSWGLPVASITFQDQLARSFQISTRASELHSTFCLFSSWLIAWDIWSSVAGEAR
jgi:hypothetical protein